MTKRFFTLEEARSALPQIKVLLEKARRLSQDLGRYTETVRLLAESASNDAGSPLGTAYFELLLSVQVCLAKLAEMGCLTKSVEEGLVDFPHLREGREVYLCWKLGEDDIRYWHEVDTGFAGRRSLNEHQ